MTSCDTVSPPCAQPRRPVSSGRPMSASRRPLLRGHVGATTHTSPSVSHGAVANAVTIATQALADSCRATRQPSSWTPQEGVDVSPSRRYLGTKAALDDPLNYGEYWRETARQMYAMGSRSEVGTTSGLSTLDVSRVNQDRHNSRRIDTFNTPSKLGPGRTCSAGDAPLGMSDFVNVFAEGVSAIRDDLASAVNQTVADVRSELAIATRETLQSLHTELRAELSTLRTAHSEWEQRLVCSFRAAIKDEMSDVVQAHFGDLPQFFKALSGGQDSIRDSQQKVLNAIQSFRGDTFDEFRSLNDSAASTREGIDASEKARVREQHELIDVLAQTQHELRTEIITIIRDCGSDLKTPMPALTDEAEIDRQLLKKLNHDLDQFRISTISILDEIKDGAWTASRVSLSTHQKLLTSFEEAKAQLIELGKVQMDAAKEIRILRTSGESTQSLFHSIQVELEKANSTSQNQLAQLCVDLGRLPQASLDSEVLEAIKEQLFRNENLLANVQADLGVVHSKAFSLAEFLDRQCKGEFAISEGVTKVERARFEELFSAVAQMRDQFETVERASQIETTLVAIMQSMERFEVNVLADTVSSVVASNISAILTRYGETGTHERKEMLVEQRTSFAKISSAIELLCGMQNVNRIDVGDSGEILSSPMLSKILDSMRGYCETCSKERNEILAEQRASVATILTAMESLSKHGDSKTADVVVLAEAVSSTVVSRLSESLTKYFESGSEELKELIEAHRASVARIMSAAESLAADRHAQMADVVDMAEAVSSTVLSNISDSLTRYYSSDHEERHNILEDQRASAATILSALESLAKDVHAKMVDVVVLGEGVSSAVMSNISDTLTRYSEIWTEDRNEILAEQRTSTARISSSVELLVKQEDSKRADMDRFPDAISSAVVSNISDLVTRQFESDSKERSETLAEQRNTAATMLSALELLTKHVDTKEADLLVLAEAVSHMSDTLMRFGDSWTKERDEIFVDQRTTAATISSALAQIKDATTSDAISQLTALIVRQGESQTAERHMASDRLCAELRSCVEATFEAKLLEATKVGAGGALPRASITEEERIIAKGLVDEMLSLRERVELAGVLVSGRELTTKADLKMALEELRGHFSLVLAAASRSALLVGESPKRPVGDFALEGTVGDDLVTDASSPLGITSQTLVEVSSKCSLNSGGSSIMVTAGRPALHVALAAPSEGSETKQVVFQIPEGGC